MEPGSPEGLPAAASDLAARRARYLALFESWLDRALAEEPPPGGIEERILADLEAGEAGPAKADLYALFEALTALTQEVKLQGRAFKGLGDALSPLLERLGKIAAGQEMALGEARKVAEEARRIAQDAEQARVREAEERCFLESVDLLFDLRDRLGRGVAAAEALLLGARRGAPGGLWARLLAPGAVRSRAALCGSVTAMLQGCRLTLDHLDDALRERGVSVIECEGRLFDPQEMSAMDLLETDEVPEGTVVEVHRAGYERNGRVLRPAQVKVAREPGAGGGE
jgi:molecular chaperone GrpE